MAIHAGGASHQSSRWRARHAASCTAAARTYPRFQRNIEFIKAHGGGPKNVSCDPGRHTPCPHLAAASNCPSAHGAESSLPLCVDLCAHARCDLWNELVATGERARLYEGLTRLREYYTYADPTAAGAGEAVTESSAACGRGLQPHTLGLDMGLLRRGGV